MYKRPKLHHEDDDDLSSETKLQPQHDIDLSDASSSPLLLLTPPSTPTPSPSSTPSPPSSSPTPSPPPPSAETTQKVYLSWCKNSGKEYERVPQLVERLRRLLWLKRIKVFDQDFLDNYPDDEVTSSIVLIFGTINYFADLGCLEELKLIWDSKPFRIIPLFYNKDGEMQRFYNKFSLAPLYDRPLLKPLNEHWDPPPLKFIIQGTNGKIHEIKVNVALDERGKRPKELVDRAVEEELAKAEAKDNNKDEEAEGGDGEGGDLVEAESEDNEEGEDLVDAEGEDNEEGGDLVEAESEDNEEGEDLVDAEGEDLVDAEGEDNEEGENVDEGEDNEESDSDTDNDDDDKAVYVERKEEPLTLGSFFHKTARNISWMSVPSDASLQTEYDEINIYALKVWVASNPAGLDYRYKVGLESHLNALLPFFNPVQEAGKGLMCILIEGPAGSGKSTLAKFLYNTISARLKHFQNFKYIRHPESFSEDNLIAYIFKRTPRSLIRNQYYNTPFLVFLDNINSTKDAQHIAPVLELMPKRSTVVIVTRSPDLVLRELPSNVKHHRYTIEGLDEHLSMELFSLKAFEQNHPPNNYIKLAQSAVYRADGSRSKLLYLASQVRLIDEDDLGTLVTMEDYESLWDTLQSKQSKGITMGACHDKCEKNDESKLTFPTAKALTNKIASGLLSLKILADLVDRLEETYLEDPDYRHC